MAVDLKRDRFTRADYHRMAQTGILKPDVRVELIEVADTSESYDRRTKAPRYARFGIPELWIVDVNRAWITRYLDPTATGYGTTRVYRRGESLSPLAFPNVMIAVNDVLG
jgi:Uma2 family endonuclease